MDSCAPAKQRSERCLPAFRHSFRLKWSFSSRIKRMAPFKSRDLIHMARALRIALVAFWAAVVRYLALTFVGPQALRQPRVARRAEYRSVAVPGATGRLGRLVVNELLKAGLGLRDRENHNHNMKWEGAVVSW